MCQKNQPVSISLHTAGIKCQVCTEHKGSLGSIKYARRTTPSVVRPEANLFLSQDKKEVDRVNGANVPELNSKISKLAKAENTAPAPAPPKQVRITLSGFFHPEGFQTCVAPATGAVKKDPKSKRFYAVPCCVVRQHRKIKN